MRAHAIATAAAADVQPIEISLPHVQRALSANVHDDGAEDVFALLLRVAREINRRSAADVAAGRAPLGDYVRQNNVLFAMLWSQARDGGALDPATIAGMLGKERSMLQRNYTKELRRELQRLEDFARRVTDE